ncbi:DUF5360 family protein [Paenibacillus arenosi]|uniref:DUF5360 family protein n=1 Tax=Paenibacillus arenosi TaxID=2774142 RepID=A0ABR9AST2_9BACL|nr:DUF5360 family protein [Paenibacillus arenosi]MBD8497169.1 DUF5360 family protein [Paenibacillus arenosi]
MTSSSVVSLKIMWILFWMTDVGFILYWTSTAFGLIPPEYAYNDYTNPILVAWNWSFAPIDIVISVTGFISIYLWRTKRLQWSIWALISLVLTSASGLMAISYWAIRGEFDLLWWLPNLFLLLYPLLFVRSVALSVSGNKTLVRL